MFIENKYTKWYNSIIKNRKNNPVIGYTEKHHIIPKSLGGSNKKENIVALTAREHFICHRLLTKMTSGKNKMKMSYAIRCLMNRENSYQHRYKVTSHVYENIISDTKKIISKYQKGINNPYYGKKHSQEVIAKMKAKRAMQIMPKRMNKIYSEETLQRWRDAAKKQFEDPAMRESYRIKSLLQMTNPIMRHAAGNGNRGKHWYHDPLTNKNLCCFEHEVPCGYVKGRKMKSTKFEKEV
jgi:hypothetical protein